MDAEQLHVQLRRMRRWMFVLAVAVVGLCCLQAVQWLRPPERIVLSNGDSKLTLAPAGIDLEYHGQETWLRAEGMTLSSPARGMLSLTARQVSLSGPDATGLAKLIVGPHGGASFSLASGTASRVTFVSGPDHASVSVDARGSAIEAYASTRGATLFGEGKQKFELGDDSRAVRRSE